MLLSHLFIRLVFLFAFFVFTTGGLYAQHKTIKIDLEKQGNIISPMLFGHNLEVTRRGFWGGLSAQMIANRKFAAITRGLPKQWNVIGDIGGVYIDTTTFYAGRQSLSLNISKKGSVAGIHQQHQIIAVRKGNVYVIRLWVKTNERRSLTIRLYEASGKKLYSKRFETKGSDWELLTTEFAAPLTSTNCKFEIISQDQGRFWIGAVSLLPIDNFHGMRTDVVEMLKRLKPGCGILFLERRALAG